MSRKYDVVIWGATGFTGRLITQYFCKNYPPCTGVTFAIAGRNEEKLMEVRLESGRVCNCSVAQVDIITASLSGEETLDRMAASAKVVLAAAGPFDVLGTPVVDACVRQGTNYVDITGETQWVRKIIDKHHDEAVRMQISIVPCCGFDCIPADLGCYFMVSALRERQLVPKEVRFVMDDASGTFSNGTCSTMLHLLSSCSVQELAALMNPYCLNPRDELGGLVMPCTDPFQFWRASDKTIPEFEKVLKCWTIPYIMQGIDCRLVNRANAVGDWMYGKDFVFSERMKVDNIVLAVVLSVFIPIIGLMMYFSVTRSILRRFLPSPGTGPSVEVQRNGFFKIKLWGRGFNTATGEFEIITGGIDAMRGDPGYLQCSRMVSEAAMCLATKNVENEKTDLSCYGVVPPSVAFGKSLLVRLSDIGIDMFVDN